MNNQQFPYSSQSFFSLSFNKTKFCKRFNEVGTQYKIHEMYIRSAQKHK